MARLTRIAFITIDRLVIPLNLREYCIAEEMCGRGHEVIWLRADESSEVPKDPRIETKSIKHPREFKGSRIAYPLYLCRVLAKERTRAVWVSGWSMRDPLGLLWYALCLKCSGIKVLYDPIDPVIEYEESMNKKKARLLDRICMRAVYGLADATVAVTDELKRLLVSHGAPGKKIFVGEWGTDAARFLDKEVDDRRTTYGYEKKFVIGWLGTMSGFKGIEEILVPLIEEMPRRVENIEFLIGGKGVLESKIAALQKDRPVRFLGEVPYDEAAAFTATLDLYLITPNPSSDLGDAIMPVKLFDALAVGVPVLLTETAATRRAGTIFKSLQFAAFDYRDVAKSIMEVIRNYPLIKKAVMDDRSIVGKYTHQSLASKIVDHVENL